MPSIKTKYANNPLINASGCLCATKKMLDELCSGESGSIISKSATLQPRQGNPEPRYWESSDRCSTLNSMGLPNCGIKYYLDYYKNLSRDVCNKTRFISIAGMSLDENKALIDIILDETNQYYKYIDAIEINLSCPNLIGHQLLGYDFDELERYLCVLIKYIKDIMEKNGCERIKFGLKLPPYYEFYQFDKIVKILAPYNGFINFIHCINSVPNALIIDPKTETPVIKPKDGFGGLGGSIIKPIALANVRAFYTRFQSQGIAIDIIGSGGVTTGTDVFEFILAGAEMVSIGSQLMMEGVSCFERILDELDVILRSKGYISLDEFRGKLKSL